ncbi:MAG: cysteine desulfurase [Erysipelotrichaceae bacterium]|nr:cysteine desulfurase [Erysipelotrichaceae bacterium]
MFNVDEIRKDFPMFASNPGLVYFDSSATSFKPQCVIDKVTEYYSRYNCNIHRGDYDISYKVSKEYDDTRETVRHFINANSYKEIVFTNGASSSLNTVAYGYGMKNLKEGDVVLSTYVEHASSILPWFEVCKKTGSRVEYIPLNDDATFNLEKYEECFKTIENIKIVAVAHVSNVMGYIYPVKEICEIAHKYGAIVTVDGAQSVPHVKVDVKNLDCDFLSFSSHKMCGPAGVGVLYGKYELLQNMDTLLLGGGSNARFDSCGNILLKNAPDKFESGTPCIEGVLGLKKAIEYLESIGMDEIDKYVADLTEYAMNKLSKLDNVELYNPTSRNGIITFNVKNIFSQDVSSYLNSRNIAVRSGNHCAKILLNIIKVSETIRASLYFYNTKKEIDYFVDIIKDTTIEKCVDAIL